MNTTTTHHTDIPAQFHQPDPIYHSYFKTESRKCFIGIRSLAKQDKILNPFKTFLILDCKIKKLSLIDTMPLSKCSFLACLLTSSLPINIFLYFPKGFETRQIIN